MAQTWAEDSSDINRHEPLHSVHSGRLGSQSLSDGKDEGTVADPLYLHLGIHLYNV